MERLDDSVQVDVLVRNWIERYSGPEICLADLLCDRHARTGRIALRYEDSAGREDSFRFAELQDLSARFAGVLQNAGISKGDRVATLLPKIPELVISALALWRLGAVHVPLFTAFGPGAVSFRLENSGARVLITNAANRPKIEPRAGLHVVTVELPDPADVPLGDTRFWQSLESSHRVPVPVSVSGDDLFILIYTSGTTGHPKGVEVPVKALASMEAYMRFGLDVHSDDRFWNLADPGWAYGLYYALVGPLLLGQTTLFFNAPFHAEAVYRLLAKYQITNFAAAPTAFRAMRLLGVPEGARKALQLRAISSAGEPLNPEVISWGVDNLGLPIHDHYGQTELGMIVMNHHCPALRAPLIPGSMGCCTTGFRVVIVNTFGEELGPAESGEIAVDTHHSPLYWFRGYFQNAACTAERFVGNGRYYRTGDAASRNASGYFFFSSRADDIINSASYRIGPFEVESALIAHQAVAEAAVVGKPDELRGEAVKAYVVLKRGCQGSEELADELKECVRVAVSAHAYPREIEFVNELPKTPSGKVQRFLLRQR